MKHSSVMVQKIALALIALKCLRRSVLGRHRSTLVLALLILAVSNSPNYLQQVRYCLFIFFPQNLISKSHQMNKINLKNEKKMLVSQEFFIF